VSDRNPDELVTVYEIAQRCGVEQATVWSWRHRGHLGDPFERVGRTGRWRWGDVERVPVIRRAIGRPQAAGDGQ
jgi:predicted DNA-binding transcriptional regulator AlpA